MAKQNTANVKINKMGYFEQLGLITNSKTPLYSLLKKVEKVRGKPFEIAMDTDGDATFDSVPEGTDVTTYENALENADVVLQRHTKIRKTWMVTDEQLETANPIGIADQKAYAVTRAMLKLTKAIDTMIGSDQEMEAGKGQFGDKCRCLGAWTNPDSTDIPALYRTPSEQVCATDGLKEAAFDAVLAACFEQTGEVGNYQLFAGTTLKKAIKKFSRENGTDNNAALRCIMPSGERSIKWAVNIYDSDFGIVHVVPSNNLGRKSGEKISATSRSRGYLIDTSKVVLSFAKDIRQKELEDGGAGPRGYVEARVTTIVKAPQILAKFN